MTHKITSIKDMCECPSSDCHTSSDITRCISYAPLTLYHRELKPEQTGYKIKVCEHCAEKLLTEFYSVLPPQQV